MDPLDRATQLEMDHRQRALEAQRSKAIETENPNDVDGVRYCLDCDDVIPRHRLEARPQSVRCIDCQNSKEKREAGFAWHGL